SDVRKLELAQREKRQQRQRIADVPHFCFGQRVDARKIHLAICRKEQVEVVRELVELLLRKHHLRAVGELLPERVHNCGVSAPPTRRNECVGEAPTPQFNSSASSAFPDPRGAARTAPWRSDHRSGSSSRICRSADRTTHQPPADPDSESASSVPCALPATSE